MKRCDVFVVKMFFRNGNVLKDVGSAFSPAVIDVKGCSEKQITTLIGKLRKDVYVNVEKMLDVNDEDVDEMFETGGIGDFKNFKRYMKYFACDM